jgi:hypothetical protein
MNGTMEIGKTYKAEWMILGCPRTALFQVQGFTRDGKAKGLYLDAGATKWVRHSVKPEHFARYSAVS